LLSPDDLLTSPISNINNGLPNSMPTSPNISIKKKLNHSASENSFHKSSIENQRQRSQSSNKMQPQYSSSVPTNFFASTVNSPMPDQLPLPDFQKQQQQQQKQDLEKQMQDQQSTPKHRQISLDQLFNSHVQTPTPPIQQPYYNILNVNNNNNNSLPPQQPQQLVFQQPVQRPQYNTPVQHRQISLDQLFKQPGAS